MKRWHNYFLLMPVGFTPDQYKRLRSLVLNSSYKYIWSCVHVDFLYRYFWVFLCFSIFMNVIFWSADQNQSVKRKRNKRRFSKTSPKLPQMKQAIKKVNNWLKRKPGFLPVKGECSNAELVSVCLSVCLHISVCLSVYLFRTAMRLRGLYTRVQQCRTSVWPLSRSLQVLSSIATATAATDGEEKRSTGQQIKIILHPFLAIHPPGEFLPLIGNTIGPNFKEVLRALTSSFESLFCQALRWEPH